jgi:flagellar motor switch protein FliN/FliY
MMDNPADPPEIPPEEPEGAAPPPTEGEVLPPEGDSEDFNMGTELAFDDLPDPPGMDMPLRSAFAPEEEDGGPSLQAVYDVPVRVQAVLGRARMPISELVSMHPGHVFELDRRVGEPIDVLVNDRLIARGEIVMIDGLLGVTLTEIVKSDA